MKSNVLVILGCLFAVSLLGRSFALADNDASAKALDTNSGKEQLSEGAPPSEENRVCVTGPILESFKERRLLIEEKEAAIQDRERTLEALEKRISERMAALDESNTRLEEKMTVMRNMAQEDVAHLTRMYQNMKPKQAGEIFNKMDTVFAAGFLRLMDSNQAGLIMASMDTDKAYAISIVIASQNAEFRPSSQEG